MGLPLETARAINRAVPYKRSIQYYHEPSQTKIHKFDTHRSSSELVTDTFSCSILDRLKKCTIISIDEKGAAVVIIAASRYRE